MRGLAQPANARFFSQKNNNNPKGPFSKEPPAQQQSHKKPAPQAPVKEQPVKAPVQEQVVQAAPKTEQSVVTKTEQKREVAKDHPSKYPRLTDIAHLEYKKYPNVPHNDPNSPEYIHSERDEYHDSTKVKAYNYTIDRLKSDIQMQQEVYTIIENLDRPYKRGTPGVTRNITGGVRDYFPPEDIGFTRVREDDDQKFFDEHFNNMDRWERDAVFYPKYYPIKSDLEWQKEVENRPVNKHFHADKGYKYDIEIPYEKRFPHVADRMGYPEILGTPLERLLRLEGEIYHPTYLDQPFIQVPTSDPHPSLNFEEGEVIYENTKILEWAKFWNFTGWSAYAFCAVFIPFNLLYKTHMPLPSAYDNLFVPYYTQSMHFIDTWTLHAPLMAMFATYGAYLSIGLAHSFWKDYVVKMQYSKDRELLFVTRISPFCSTEEEVYEVQHLEALPPSVKVGTADLSSQDADGLWDITCLASHRNLVLYNEDKYWNPALKKDFFDKTMNLWTSDVVEPSRLETIRDVAYGPKIQIGKQTEEDLKKLEGAH